MKNRKRKTEIRESYMVLVAIFLICIGSSVSTLHAQSGLSMSASGNVRDVNSNKFIPNIRIFLFKIEYGQLTRAYSDVSNNSGYYKIRFLPAGKYRFGIDIPDIGYLHIFWLSDNGSALVDYYDVEIKEGQNKIINILLGEAQYPSVSKLDNDLLGEICFTIEYTSNSLKDIETIGKAAQTPCEKLTITGPDIDVVGDDVPLLSMKGEPANGQIVFETSFKYAYDCFKEKCFYDNFRLNVNIVVKLHTPNYYKQFYPEIDDNNFFLCLKECTSKHEMYHFNAYPPVACKWWKEFLNGVNSMEKECCTDKESCRENMNKRWGKYSAEIDKEMGETETGTETLSKKCDSDCLENANKKSTQ